MDFIQKWSNICANYLSTKVPNTKFPSVEDQIEVYKYGVQVILGALVKGIILLILALLLEILVPVIFITITFSSLRIIAGGYHFQSYNKCAFISYVIFIGSALLVKHTYQYWTDTNIYGLLIFSVLAGLYVLIKYAPRDTINKPIVKISDVKRLKKWTLIYLLIWSMNIIICFIFNFKLIVISSCFGLLLELFSVSDFGYKKIYTKINNINLKI
jgi:accessory gene regulator B